MSPGILLAFSLAGASEPQWAKRRTLDRDGYLLRVVCSAEAPSLDIARREALNSCRRTASDQLETSVRVKTVVIETEKEVALHEESRSDSTYTGLDCIPEAEESEDKESSVKVWIRCRFDLTRAKVAHREAGTSGSASSETGRLSIKNQGSLGDLSTSGDPSKPGRYISGQRRTLFIASVPPCRELLVRGALPRVVMCSESPMPLVVEPGDTEIVVRARYALPKSIRLGSEGPLNESVEVILEHD